MTLPIRWQSIKRFYSKDKGVLLGRLNHIAYATSNASQPLAFYRQPQPEHGVYTTFVDLGNTKLEFLEPLGEASPITNFLAKQPRGGVHHVCYEVSDLKVVIKQLADQGIKPIEPPKIGAHGNPVIFVHPRDAGGILTEFEQVALSVIDTNNADSSHNNK